MTESDELIPAFRTTIFDNVRIPVPEPISLRHHPLENIRLFKRQWKYFCISTGLNSVSAEKKVASFFLCIGREALTYVHDNLELNDEEMNDCDRILAALEASHQTHLNVIYQRFLFHQTVQSATDTIDCFVSKLRELAEQCGFEDRLEEMVRDRFIVGLRNKEIQTELLSKTELSLSNAVHICKLKELEEVNIRPLNGGVKNAQEIPNRAHSATVDVDTRPAECSVKVEKLDDDDDLIILSHRQKGSATSSDRAAKKIKLEPSKGVDDYEEFHPQVVDVESDQSRETSSEFMKVGSFVVSKEDWNKLADPPIWKIDSPALVQKFVPIEYNGITLHKSTAVYSGWSQVVTNNFYKAPVEPRPKQSNKKHTIVLFQKDLVPIENQFEKVNGNDS